MVVISSMRITNRIRSTMHICAEATVVHPSTMDELLSYSGYPVIGFCSNLIPDPNKLSMEDVFVALDEEAFSGISIDGSRVTVGAGAILYGLVIKTVDRGLIGFEGLAGIPGTVGGALKMNAGGRHGNISDNLISVKVLRDNQYITIPKSDIVFGNRYSDIDGIIVSAIFELTLSDYSYIPKLYMDGVVKGKGYSQPLSDYSCGCFFKTCEAGRIIDECGLKGFAYNGAMISRKHANFIINYNNATFDDIVMLEAVVKHTVLVEQGIILEREIVYLP